jgi:cytoskeletal protein CcmA (bactofilin family)
MFAKKPPAAGPAPKSGKASANGLSFFGPEVVVNGDVATTANLHVDGRIDGHVRCGQLCQGASGTIAGDIVADEARIAGKVEGTVDARILIVEASARIAGDVTYETISIAAGAQIDGRLARRAALAAGEPAMLVATPTEPASQVKSDALFPLAEPKRAAVR